MGKIERHNDWCSYDSLDGERLKDGEILEITFPDGWFMTAAIRLAKWSESISDHGHASAYPQERAEIDFSLHGIRVVIPLAGLEAERIAT